MSSALYPAVAFISFTVPFNSLLYDSILVFKRHRRIPLIPNEMGRGSHHVDVETHRDKLSWLINRSPT